MKRTQKRALGLVFWTVAIAAAVFGAANLMQTERGNSGPRQTIESVARYVMRTETTFRQIDPTSSLRLGDPVFSANDEPGADGGTEFRQVGRVSEVIVGPSQTEVEIVWYDSEVPADQCQLFQYHSTGRLSEVVETLMPPEKQQAIRDEISRAMARHGQELSQAFVPLVEESLKKSMPVIEDEFRRSVARHRSELDAAAQRWNDELVQDRLIPMARREILPIVKKHGQPPAEAIGREIWDRASLFRFGWRAIYDKTPLPRKDLLREEWQRFVEEEAVPVLEEHMDEIVVAIQRSVRDVSKNPAIRQELSDVAEQIAADPQSRRLVQTILKETFVENPELHQVWRQVWSSDKARAAFEIAGDRMEPVVRKIGDQIFGSEEDGINPDFARVLRTQILRKDRRWIVAWHTGAGNGVIEVAKKTMPYPVVYVAQEN
ncbi:MAG: hypothetical protein KDB00_13295 [Planctomycetales bacterium]|nr:hypothetical protein [Planctomycetales bacterium]